MLDTSKTQVSSFSHSDTSHGLHDLMERYIDGDQRAFDGLYQRLSPRVRARLGRMIRNDALVDDLVQQAFMRAHQARARYEVGTTHPDRAVEGWYLAIARNVALDYLRQTYRRDKRHATLLARGETEGMGAPAEVPNAEEVRMELEREEERISLIRGALDQLPETQREVVAMHKLGGLSMAEISEKLDVRQGALRVRAHRAYKSLARLLAPEGPAPSHVPA